tara:strand:+ start:1097 stop:2602 length:1506 start_codon:yes stop_codon:yes gene_type:complete
MGAYENPITVVDNQSGQIWANTISNVAKATTNYIDFTRQKNDERAKKIQEQLNWAAEYASKNQEQVYTNLRKLGADSIYSEEADNVLNLVTEYRIAMQNASTKEELKIAQERFGKAQKRLQQLYGVIEMDEKSKIFYGEEFDPATAGMQGGMSKSKPGTADWVAAQNVNNGFAKGQKEVYWDDETGAYKMKFSGENIEGVIDKDARLLFGYDPGRVPGIDSMIYATYQKAGYLDKNNQLTDSAMSNYKFTKLSDNGKYETLYTATAANRIAQNTTSQFESQARSFFTVPEDAENVWAIIGKESNKQFSASELLQQGSEMQTEFVKAYAEYASKLIPNYKENNTYQTKAVSGKGGKGGSGEAKALANAEAFVVQFSENLDSFGMARNKDGTIFGKVEFDNISTVNKGLAGLGYSLVDDGIFQDDDGNITEIKIKKNFAKGTESFTVNAGDEPYVFFQNLLEAEGVGKALAQQIAKNLLYTGRLQRDESVTDEGQKYNQYERK